MTALEKVLELQKEGVSESEIIERLQHQGIPPKVINDALNHARIKSAVMETENAPQSQEYYQEQQPIPPQEEQPQEQYAPTPESYGESPYPQTSQDTAYQDPNFYQPPQQEAQPQAGQNYYTPAPQAYGEQSYVPQGGTDSEMIAEIAEQVFYEKSEEFIKETKDISSLKNEIKNKVEDLDIRLRRIEDSIEKLQNAVIGKMGEFGQNSASIHKDLDNLHNTVSKMMGPLSDTYHELKKMAKH